MKTGYIGEERALPIHFNGAAGGELGADGHVTKRKPAGLVAYVGPGLNVILGKQSG